MSSPSSSEMQSKIYTADSRQNRGIVIRITLAASLASWVYVFNITSWGPLLAPLADRLHISLVTASFFWIIYSLGYLIGAPAGGAMLDRYGPRRVLIWSLLYIFCCVFCIFMSLFLPHGIPVWALLGLAGLEGIGGGMIDASTNGLISAIYAEKRGAVLNLFNLLFPLGGGITALIDAGLLATFHNDIRLIFLFSMGFIFIAIFSLHGVPVHYCLPVESQASAVSQNDTLLRIRSLIVLLAPVIAVMLLTDGINASVRTWTPAYLHVTFSQAPAIAAVLSSITWVLAALSRLSAAGIILRIGPWRVMMLGFLISLCGFVALFLSSNAVFATIAIAIASLGLAPLYPACLTIASERAGRSYGSVAGIVLCTSGISAIFCGWFFGVLLNATRPTWAVLFCLCFILLGMLMTLPLRPTRSKIN